MRLVSRLAQGEMICAGVRSPGAGVDVELTDAQAEQPLRKGYVSIPEPAADPVVEDVEEQAPAKKK